MRFGILIRKECWCLTWYGRALLSGLILLFSIVFVWAASPFLSINNPISAEFLVVEAWIPGYVINQVAQEFLHAKYRTVIVVNSSYDAAQRPIQEVGGDDYLARLLARAGVPPSSINTVTFAAVEKDRTYHAALAVRDFLSKRGANAVSLNIATLGPHARRSRLLFRKAFGAQASIGVISLRDPMYDPDHWWRTSEGVRVVLGETIAYVYARLFSVWA